MKEQGNIDYVKISVKDYNALRDFKECVLKGESFLEIHTPSHWGVQKVEFVTRSESEVVKTISDINKSLKAEEKNLRDEIRKMNEAREVTPKNVLTTIENGVKEDITKLKKMSIWEFIDWRKTK